MMGTMKKNVEQIRREALRKRSSIDPGARSRKSEQIFSHLIEVPEVIGARILFLYVHFRSEVRTSALISFFLEQEKTVCVPLTVVDPPSLLVVRITDPRLQLAPGYCSIPEPVAEWTAFNRVDPKTIDIVFVPGSAFDLQGGRLGYGGGFYDRFLAIDSPQAIRIGLAYEEQFVDQLPLQPHDQRMDMVVTEEGVHRCRR